MKRLAFLTLLVFPALLFAQSAFDGTWKTDPSKSKLSQKPYVFSVNQGTYNCESCVPKLNVKADGQDQTVTGQTYDTIAVTASDPNSIHVVLKKDGKTVSDSTRTVSGGGNTLTVSGTYYPADGKPGKSESKLVRVSKGPAGSHATSGSWRVESFSEDDAGLTATWKVSGDEVSFSTGDGMNWTAKSGGGEVPVKGQTFKETVKVKKMGAREIEVTYMRDGKPYLVEKRTVSADGKTMTTVADFKWTNRVSTYIDQKQ